MLTTQTQPPFTLTCEERVNQTNYCPFKNVSVTSDLGVGSGLGVTITLTLLQEPEFHGEDKAGTCNNKWQTSAMLVSDTNAHVFTSDWRADRRLRRGDETERRGSGVEAGQGRLPNNLH